MPALYLGDGGAGPRWIAGVAVHELHPSGRVMQERFEILRGGRIVTIAGVDVTASHGQCSCDLGAKPARAAGDERHAFDQIAGLRRQQPAQHRRADFDRSEPDVRAQVAGRDPLAVRGCDVELNIEQPERRVETNGAGAIDEFGRVGQIGRERKLQAGEQRAQARHLHADHVAAQPQHACLHRAQPSDGEVAVRNRSGRICAVDLVALPQRFEVRRSRSRSHATERASAGAGQPRAACRRAAVIDASDERDVAVDVQRAPGDVARRRLDAAVGIRAYRVPKLDG